MKTCVARASGKNSLLAQFANIPPCSSNSLASPAWCPGALSLGWAERRHTFYVFLLWERGGVWTSGPCLGDVDARQHFLFFSEGRPIPWAGESPLSRFFPNVWLFFRQLRCKERTCLCAFFSLFVVCLCVFTIGMRTVCAPKSVE